MRYRVKHVTTYDYEAVVFHGRHIAHQRLRSTSHQVVENSELSVTPRAAWRRAGIDFFGNETDNLEISEEHDQLRVEVLSHVTVAPQTADFTQPQFQQSWEKVRDLLLSDASYLSARQFNFDSPLVKQHPALSSLAGPIFQPGRPVYDCVVELNHRIFEDFSYEPATTDASTPLAQVLREKRGVCQDFAHVAVGVLRSLGLAARYVSGYLETQPPPGKPRLVGADASHAWASVFVPGWGWLDFDPTNDLLPSERHVTVGWGRDFSDVSPLKGIVLGGGRHVVNVGVDVAPLAPDAAPRPSTLIPAPLQPQQGAQAHQQKPNEAQSQSQQQNQAQVTDSANEKEKAKSFDPLF